MKVGDIVFYKKDWRGKRPWYLYRMVKGDLCTIILLRDGKYTHIKHFKQGNYEWDEEYLNASIVNLDISNIELL